MKPDEILRILRNPYEQSPVNLRQAQLEAAEFIERHLEDTKAATSTCALNKCTCTTLVQKKICFYSSEDWLEP